MTVSGAVTDAPAREIDAPRSATVLFHGAVVVLTILALSPIWILRLLPMQDYPESLFFEQVVNTWSNPAFDWPAHYALDWSVRPYIFWFLLMKPLAGALGVELAGRVMMSVYVLLVGALVLACRRFAPRGAMPWGALLLFPLAFNQIYFMGFMNFVLSLPILFLTLVDLEAIVEGTATRWRLTRHAVLLVLLMMNHPLTLLTYGGLAGAGALGRLPNRRSFWRAAAPALTVAGVFLAYYVLKLTQPDSQAKAGGVRWWSLEANDAYYVLQFTGMRWLNGPDWLQAIVWLCAAGLLFLAWRRGTAQGRPLRPAAFMFLATVAGFLVLPFWYLYYSYLNVRLAPVSYFALVLLASRLSTGPKTGGVLAACSAVLVLMSIRTQATVSAEIAEILPVLKVMPKNQVVLPLLFDTSAEAIDPAFFQDFHSHDPSYYHLLVGGGVSPAILEHPLGPVHYRPGYSLPAPASPEAFSWDQYGASYDYFLARGASQAFTDDMLQHADLAARSGSWDLFRNRTGPSGRTTAAGG